MQCIGIKTRLIKPNENLKNVILQAFKNIKIRLKERDILVITSKVVSVCQNRIAKIGSKNEFLKLVKKEADKFFGGKIPLTLKNNILIPQAGIDLSNIKKGFAILWPKDPFGIAWDLYKFFCRKFGLKKLGIVISDSHCQPLRLGTTGIAIGFAGFKGVEDQRGKKDLFGKPLKVTRKASADNLASTSLLIMGEASEKIPFVLIRGAKVKFTKKPQKFNEIFIKPQTCLFAPVFKKLW